MTTETKEQPFPDNEYERLFWYREKAREMYVSEDIEIEAVTSRVSMSEEGAWVEGWLWVPSPERSDE